MSLTIPYVKLDPAVPDLARHSAGAGGIDLVAAPIADEAGARHFPYPEGYLIDAGGSALIATGVAVAIPAGHAGIILLRSSFGIRAQLSVHVGLIDSDYRGEIFVRVIGGPHPCRIRPYERFAQLLVVPFLQASPVQVPTLDATRRGRGWAGSTG